MLTEEEYVSWYIIEGLCVQTTCMTDLWFSEGKVIHKTLVFFLLCL